MLTSDEKRWAATSPATSRTIAGQWGHKYSLKALRGFEAFYKRIYNQIIGKQVDNTMGIHPLYEEERLELEMRLAAYRVMMETASIAIEVKSGR